MTQAEQVITIKVSILNVPEEGVATRSYTFTNDTTLEELSHKFAETVRETTADAVMQISSQVLENAVANFR